MYITQWEEKKETSKKQNKKTAKQQEVKSIRPFDKHQGALVWNSSRPSLKTVLLKDLNRPQSDRQLPCSSVASPHATGGAAKFDST